MLDSNKLKEALRQTLNHFPALSGRYEASDKHGDRISNFRAGACFEVVELNDPCAPLYESSADWEKHLVFNKIFDRPGPNDSLLRVRITNFCKQEISLLAVCFSYAVADMASATRFMSMWSWYCDGGLLSDRSQPDLPPPLNQRRHLKFKSPVKVANLKYEGIYNPYHPFDNRHWLKRSLEIFPKLVWNLSKCGKKEFKIPHNHLKEWQTKINAKLNWQDDGQKVSRWEIAQSLLFYADAKISGVHTRTVYPIIDARRSMGDDYKNYFGNFLGSKSFELSMPPVNDNDETLDIVAKLAEQQRATISGPPPQ